MHIHQLQGGLSTCCPYVGCVLARRHLVNGHVYTNTGLDNNEIAFFSLTSRGLPLMGVMAGFEYTVGEINVLPTVAYLNKIILGVGFRLGLSRHCTWLSHKSRRY